jgi:D-alanine-D-alanine ligase
MQKKLTITVLLGGPSAEREVSLRTGQAAARALRSLGHEVFEVDPQPGLSALPPGTDIVFLALHGTYGEDGTVQAELERLGVPYTGCGPEASRIAFDKVLTKERCVAAGVPTAQYVVIENLGARLPSELPLPLVVKPVRQGSSVGLQFVNTAAEWPAALTESLRFDSQVLVEQRIVGRETTVGILDYKNKYTSGATEYLCPAPFDSATTARIQDAALRAFDAIGGRDYARVDVMVTQSNEPVVLEVNTLPGLTETSLLPKAAAAAGISYAALCQRMIDLALVRPALAV